MAATVNVHFTEGQLTYIQNDDQTPVTSHYNASTFPPTSSPIYNLIMAEPRRLPRLFTIPIQLQEYILEFLPYPTLQILSITHRHFRTLIDLSEVIRSTPREKLVHEMVAAYRSNDFRWLKAMRPCRECLRFKPEDKFSDNMFYDYPP